MQHYNSSAFKDPQVRYPIDNLNLPFDDYIAQSKTIISNTRVDLANNPKAQDIIEANSPFCLEPSTQKTNIGALLIHGLLDSPFVMKDIGLHLQSEGLVVHSILLPGHGTVPGGLLQTSYQDWSQAVNYGIASLAKKVERIILVGFSTGASLALHHVLQALQEKNTTDIAGLILIAPAIKLYSPLTRMANVSYPLYEVWERSRWINITNENDYAKYQSITFNAVNQVNQLIKSIQRLTPPEVLPCPLQIIISDDDKTVSSQATCHYFRQHASAKDELLIYSNRMKQLSDERFILRPGAFPEWHIDNISHVALPIAPENKHYGKQGDYAYASRVEENSQQGEKYRYGSYNSFQRNWVNLLGRMKRAKQIHWKLTFNPDFAFLKKFMSGFIARNF